MHQVSVWNAQGKHEAAYRWSSVLCDWCPVCLRDTNFLLQAAHAQQRSEQGNRGLIDFAKGYENWSRARFDEAAERFQSALEADPRLFLARGYLSSALLRNGVVAFEQGQPERAAEQFRLAQQAFPAHIQAIYYQMVARVVVGDYEGSAQLAAKLKEAQDYFQIPGIAAIGQAHLHEAWAAFHRGDLPDAWDRHFLSIDRGGWE